MLCLSRTHHNLSLVAFFLISARLKIAIFPAVLNLCTSHPDVMQQLLFLPPTQVAPHHVPLPHNLGCEARKQIPPHVLLFLCCQRVMDHPPATVHSLFSGKDWCITSMWCDGVPSSWHAASMQRGKIGAPGEEKRKNHWQCRAALKKASVCVSCSCFVSSPASHQRSRLTANEIYQQAQKKQNATTVSLNCVGLQLCY